MNIAIPCRQRHFFFKRRQIANVDIRAHNHEGVRRKSEHSRFTLQVLCHDVKFVQQALVSYMDTVKIPDSDDGGFISC